MGAATEPGPRIATLDIVRGIAVMGILAMNIIAFGLPGEAYVNPTVIGMDSRADFVSWLISFIFIDGKMRGLFSFLFGASMLLVIQRAEAKGESTAAVHFRRIAWLLFFGLLHFYFIWWGDILALYAMVAMVAWLFRNKEPRSLIRWGIGLVLAQFGLFGAMAVGFSFVSAAAAGPNPDPEMVKQWAEMQHGFMLTPTQLAEELARYRDGYAGIVQHQLTEELFSPINAFLAFGWETLGYMLFGMAALKSGFLTGAWRDSVYRRTMVTGFAIGVPAYALFAWALVSEGFAIPMIVATVLAGPTLVRPAMILATASLIILLTRRGGPMSDRIAAAGRAAFTNYLGTSILMTALFYGWGGGLFGSLGRAELWFVVIGMWAVMLLWSKPWLDRYRYGPFEWLWRSLARWQPQPMRRPLVATAAG